MKEHLQYLLDQNQILSTHNYIIDIPNNPICENIKKYNEEDIFVGHKLKHFKLLFYIFTNLVKSNWLYFFKYINKDNYSVTTLQKYIIYGLTNRNEIITTELRNFGDSICYVKDEKMPIHDLTYDTKYDPNHKRKCISDLLGICDSLELEKKLFEVI